MPDDRFVNCAKHGTRRCPVCNKPAGKPVTAVRLEDGGAMGSHTTLPVTEADIPPVPSFGDMINLEAEAKIMEGVFSPEPPFQIPERGTKDPLVLAAEAYSAACAQHQSSMVRVALAKKDLESAQENENHAHKARVDAQMKLAELVAKTTEAVL